jgi:hypothetical protein
MVTAEYRVAMGAVLLAFARAQTSSRLLLTSRYDVRHPDGAGGDLAAELVRIPLAPMPERERLKQLRAAERVLGREDGTTGEAAQELLRRALVAAAGNPGLQAILTRPVLTGELAAAEQALRQISAYRETGVPPALIEVGSAQNPENALIAFFASVSTLWCLSMQHGVFAGTLIPVLKSIAKSTTLTSKSPVIGGLLFAFNCPVGVSVPENVRTQFLSLLQTDTSQTFSAAIWAARKASFQAVLSVRLGVSAPERYGNCLSERRSLSELWESTDLLYKPFSLFDHNVFTIYSGCKVDF